MPSEIVKVDRADLAPVDPMAALAGFIRLHVADGEASPRTVQAYMGEVGRYVDWCRETGIDPARAGGVSLDAIGDMLGHSSTDTTRIYAKIVRKMEENPARYLAALMG